MKLVFFKALILASFSWVVAPIKLSCVVAPIKFSWVVAPIKFSWVVAPIKFLFRHAIKLYFCISVNG